MRFEDVYERGNVLALSSFGHVVDADHFAAKVKASQPSLGLGEFRRLREKTANQLTRLGVGNGEQPLGTQAFPIFLVVVQAVALDLAYRTVARAEKEIEVKHKYRCNYT